MSGKDKNSPAAEQTRIIGLTDENGRTEEFEVLDLIEYGGADYAVLERADGSDDRVHILEIVEELDSDCDTYLGIEDSGIIEGVYDAFKKKHAGEPGFPG